MPVFNIHHVTRYQYDRPVKESVNEIKVYPYACREQEVLYHEVNISQQPDVLLVTDYWGNRSGLFNRLEAHQELTIESKLIVRTLGSAPLPSLYAGTIDDLKKDKQQNLPLIELAQGNEPDLRVQLATLCEQFFSPGMAVQQVVENCNRFIFENFRYIKGITTVETTVAEILQHKAGVCQDFAHLMLELLRQLGIPSRYVSGYICPNKNGMRGEGATHAWVEAWLPGYGWKGIDPTNNAWVAGQHVKLAIGRHFNDCTPVKGTFKGPAHQSLSVFVSVGYEDGHVFEELNNVQMDLLGTTAPDLAILQSFAGQQ
jgi:transglutaminase-like putative cysteine protease